MLFHWTFLCRKFTKLNTTCQEKNNEKNKQRGKYRRDNDPSAFG
jgi:hypothetical protein